MSKSERSDACSGAAVSTAVAAVAVEAEAAEAVELNRAADA